MKNLFFALALLTVWATPAHAVTDAEPLGVFGDWEAKYFNDAKGDLVCFMQSVPTSSTGAEGKKRGTVMMFITHWQGDKSRNVISMAAGYALKKGSRPVLSVDGKDFKLAEVDERKDAGEREMAWTADQATDDAITQALQKGSSVVVSSESQRGTKTKDTYSLKGSGDAYKAISDKCAM